MAENIAMRQQLITLTRGRQRAPKLKTTDRFIFGIVAFFVGEKRLEKIAVTLKPATILKYHRALVNRKYSRLYSNKARKRPGRKGQDQALVDLVIEMKKHNPNFGTVEFQVKYFKPLESRLATLLLAEYSVKTGVKYQLVMVLLGYRLLDTRKIAFGPCL